MYMTDALLQMAIQNACQIKDPIPGAGEVNQGNKESGSSFQDLLDQRRQEVDQTQEGKPGQEASKPTDEDGKNPSDQTQTVGAEAALLGWMLPNAGVVEINQAGEGLTQDLSGVLKVQINPVSVELGKGFHPELTLPRPVEPVAETMQTQQPTQTAQTTEASVGLAESNGLNVTTAENANATLLTDQQADTSQEFTGTTSGQEDGKSLEGVTVQSWQKPLFGDLEAAPVRVGDAPVDMTAPAQEVETNLAKTIQSSLEDGSEYLEIKLKPDNLGTVVAEFTRTPEGVLHVVLHAESEQTAKLLGDHASSLGLLLQDGSNGQVHIEVTQPQPQQQEAWQQFNQDGGQQQQQQQQQQRHTSKTASDSFAQQLRLGLVQMDEE